MATVIGIDLGAHAVKIARMEGRIGKLSVEGYYSRAVSTEGEGSLAERKFEALCELLEDLKVESAAVVAAYPADRAALRQVVLPFTDRGQIEKTLPFELESHIPFDLEDFVMDYRSLRVGRAVEDRANSRSRVLCALANREVASNILGGLKDSGVDPRNLALDSEMIAGLSTGKHEPSLDSSVEDGLLVIDFGHSRTLVSLAVDGVMIASRAISHGAAEITSALGRALGKSLEEAEQIKHSASIPSVRAAEVTEGEVSPGETGIDNIIESALAPLLSAIRASAIAFEGQTGVSVDEVLIVGGGSKLSGLAGRVEAELGVAVSSSAKTEGEEVRAIDGCFALAHALSVRAAGVTSGDEFEFRVGELAYKGSLGRTQAMFRYGAIACAILFVVSMFGFALKHHTLQGELTTLNGDIVDEVQELFPDLTRDTLEAEGFAFNLLLSAAGDVGARLELLDQTVQEGAPTLELIRALSQAMPSHEDARVEVTELTISESSVTLKAKTTGYEAAAVIEQALQDNGFDGAERGSDQRLGTGLTFVITIPREVEADGEEG
jgi:general secretion pathway protein L